MQCPVLCMAEQDNPNFLESSYMNSHIYMVLLVLIMVFIALLAVLTITIFNAVINYRMWNECKANFNFKSIHSFSEKAKGEHDSKKERVPWCASYRKTKAAFSHYANYNT